MLERMLERGDVGRVAPSSSRPRATPGSGSVAVAAKQLGLNAVFVVPERFSVEKQQLMRALGAEVVNTPSEDGMGFAIDRAHEIADELDDAVVPSSSRTRSTPRPTTRRPPPIDEALDGEVGAVVAGCGTGGTLMGMARYFRERDPDTYVVAVEPAGSAYREFLGGGRSPTRSTRRRGSAPTTSTPTSCSTRPSSTTSRPSPTVRSTRRWGGSRPRRDSSSPPPRPRTRSRPSESLGRFATAR